MNGTAGHLLQGDFVLSGPIGELAETLLNVSKGHLIAVPQHRDHQTSEGMEKPVKHAK